MAKYFDIDSARRAGVSDVEIKSYMEQNNLVPKMTAGGFVGNVGKSAGRLVSDTARLITSPIETAKGLAEIVKNPSILIDYYKERYGKDLVETLYNDPVGVIADLSIVLGGASGATKALGSVTKASGLTKVSSVLSKASRATDPLSIVTKSLGGTANKITPKLSTKLAESSENILTRGLGNPVKQAQITEKFGVTPSKFIKKYNLYDRSPETLKQVTKDIGKKYSDIIKQGGKTYNPADVVADIDAVINDLNTGSAKGSVSNQMMVKELLKRKQQFLEQLTPSKNATEDFIVDRFGTVSRPADVSSLLEFRQKGIDPDIPVSQFGLSPKESGKVAGTKKVRDILRAEINRSDPMVSQLGIDYAVAKKMEPIFSGSRSRSVNRLPIGLGNIGSTGAGAVLGGLPGAIAGAGLSYLSSSPQVIGGVSRGLESASKAVSKVPQITLPRSIETAYDISKTARFFSPQSREQLSKPDQESPRVQSQDRLIPPRSQDISSTPILPPDNKLKLKKYTPTLKFGRK